jgi:phosphoadenosine phosphosulfate reductase
MSKKLTPQEIDQANAALADKTPQEILAWAIKTFSPGVGLSSSFGGESAGLIHMAIQIDPTIPVLFLDTGFCSKRRTRLKTRCKSSSI